MFHCLVIISTSSHSCLKIMIIMFVYIQNLINDVSGIVEICATGCIDGILGYFDDCPAAIPIFGGQEAVTGLTQGRLCD